MINQAMMTATIREHRQFVIGLDSDLRRALTDAQQGRRFWWPNFAAYLHTLRGSLSRRFAHS